MTWLVDFYKDGKGREPAAEFLNAQPVGTRAKVVKVIDLLARYGVLLTEPYTRQLKGKIRELRVKDPIGNIRVLYFGFTGKRFILLHGFIKKTGKILGRELKIAERRMKDFISRYGEEP